MGDVALRPSAAGPALGEPPAERQLAPLGELPVDPVVADGLLERLLLGQAGRLDSTLLGEHEPDASADPPSATAGSHPARPCEPVQFGDRLAVLGDHQGGFAVRDVLPPALVTAEEHLLFVSSRDPAMAEVLVDGSRRTLPEPSARSSFPGFLDPAGLHELWRVAAVLGQHSEGPTGADCTLLGPVAYEQELRPGPACLCRQAVEVERRCQAGFVDDEQLPGVQLSALGLRLNSAAAALSRSASTCE